MYEYKSVIVVRQTSFNNNAGEPQPFPEVERAMNKYAKEGWRVHDVSSGDYQQYVLITFERDIKQQ